MDQCQDILPQMSKSNPLCTIPGFSKNGGGQAGAKKQQTLLRSSNSNTCTFAYFFQFSPTSVEALAAYKVLALQIGVSQVIIVRHHFWLHSRLVSGPFYNVEEKRLRSLLFRIFPDQMQQFNKLLRIKHV